MKRSDAESLLQRLKKDGTFLVRSSSVEGKYTLSVLCPDPDKPATSHKRVRNYHIITTPDGKFCFNKKHKMDSVSDLIMYHQHNSGGLATRLKHIASINDDDNGPVTAGLGFGIHEVDREEIHIERRIGRGNFGSVQLATLKGRKVAVKIIKKCPPLQDKLDSIRQEARAMVALHHQNLVQMIGVCTCSEPFYIVIEYMKHGSLEEYVKKNKAELQQDCSAVLDMCRQIAQGMAYLESKTFTHPDKGETSVIHRDLAARNCLMGETNVVKVADFGLARCVMDDQYTSTYETLVFPYPWGAPELFEKMLFSSKSDVWAFGVVMWELFTFGRTPHSRLVRHEVADFVKNGKVLGKPISCCDAVYKVMLKCWQMNAVDRPTFKELVKTLEVMILSGEVEKKMNNIQTNGEGTPENDVKTEEGPREDVETGEGTPTNDIETEDVETGEGTPKNDNQTDDVKTGEGTSKNNIETGEGMPKNDIETEDIETGEGTSKNKIETGEERPESDDGEGAPEEEGITSVRGKPNP